MCQTKETFLGNYFAIYDRKNEMVVKSSLKKTLN